VLASPLPLFEKQSLHHKGPPGSIQLLLSDDLVRSSLWQKRDNPSLRGKESYEEIIVITDCYTVDGVWTAGVWSRD